MNSLRSAADNASSLLIRGGDLVESTSSRRKDIRIIDGVVAEVGANLPIGTEPIIDADGLRILPGVIDAHCHQWEQGMASRPDFRDDSAAAAVGGISTLIDMPLTPPEIVDASRFRVKVDLGERTSLIDFGLHAGASPDRIDCMADVWAAGATGFKLFTCDTGVEMRGFIREGDLRRALETVARLDAIALVHAEDQSILDRNRTTLISAGRRDHAAFSDWHSVEAEHHAIGCVLRFAGETGARVYFVHASLPEGIARIAAARARGVRVSVETCPHYLVLTDADIAKYGPWATCAPPVRDSKRRDGLRKLLGSEIDVIASDHNTVRRESKQAGERDPFAGQPGLPGNEVMLPLLLELVAEGVLTLERCVALLCEHPARLFGLSARKGFLKPGWDGDAVLVNLDEVTLPHGATMRCRAGWTPYEGKRLRGRVVQTFVRGRCVARDGVPIAPPGFGQFVARGPSPLSA